MKKVEVVVTFLELDVAPRPGASSRAPGTDDAPLRVRRETGEASSTTAAAMYRAVGAPWQWNDRLSWDHAAWRDAIGHENVEIWIGEVGPDVVGYFELRVETDSVELKYFGLLPQFTGRGFGPLLLDAAITRTRELGLARMTVNTCTLDHPAALRSYHKAGFLTVRTETRRQEVRP